MGANLAHYVQSQDTGNVIDVKGGNLSPGAHIILWHKKPHQEATNQRWVIDEHGFIHLAGHPHLVLDIEGGGGAGTKVILWNRKDHDNANQKWKVEHGGFIESRSGHDLVLDVEGGSHKEGAHLIVWQKKQHDNKNQKFQFVP